MPKLKYRSVWISDTHLGTRGSRAKELARFLKHVRCHKLYLVGDIIDMWRLRARWYWPAEHNEVVRRILKIAKRGCDVYFLPGNHDEAARQFLDLRFGDVVVVPSIEHEMLDGRRFLVIHGDQFDLVVRHSRLVSMLGAAGYDMLLTINRWYNAVNHRLGRPYFSLSQAIKLKVKKACTYISRYEECLAEEAHKRGLDGVICGHVHHAERRGVNGVDYINCGDWVETCTAVVEHLDGRIEIIHPSEILDQLDLEDATPALMEPTGPGDRLADLDFDDEPIDAPAIPVRL